MDCAARMVRGEKTWNSVETSHCISEQLIDSYKMDLTKTIRDGEMQLRMIAHGEFSSKGSAAANGGGMIRVGGISER